MVTLASVSAFFVANRDQITLGIALLGVGLGVLNLWRDIRKTIRQERVRLEVIPKLGLRSSGSMFSSTKDILDPGAFLMVEVINHSYFPVFIDGLYLTTDCHDGKECVVMQPYTNPQREWPPKLERHEALTLYAPPMMVRELIGIGASGVYIKTSTNQRFDGTTPVFARLRAEFSKLPKTRFGTVDWEAAQM